MRGERYGYDHFDGALAPFRDEATRQRILTLLDRRVVLVVFGDNANLSASAAKTIGALLHPSVKDDPVAAEIRRELEASSTTRRRVRPALRRPGRPVLLRLGRDPRPPVRLGGPAGPVGHGPHGLPGQRVPRPATFVVACGSVCPWPPSRTWASR